MVSTQNAARLLAQAAQLRASGNLAASLAPLESACRLLPASADLQHDLALTLIHLGRFEEALRHLDAALALAPGHAPALLNRGKLRERLGLPEFWRDYAAAARAAPREPEPAARLASSLEQGGRRAEAMEAYRQAASLCGPGSFEHHHFTARAAMIADDLAAAETALRAALAITPTHAGARGTLARVLHAQGDFAGGNAQLEQALRDQPEAIALYLPLVQAQRLTAQAAPMIARMQEAARLPATPHARMQLHHALAKAFDDLGEYAAAAEHLRKAGSLRAAHFPIDRAAIRARTDLVLAMRAHAPETPARQSAAPQPILVLGLPRTGTTLTERSLARHAAIAGAGELGFWDSTAPAALAAPPATWPARLPALGAAYATQLAAAIPPGSAKRLVVDKNPFNYRWAALIAAACPGARIVHCTRHLADTALSIMLAALRPDPFFGTAPDDLLFCMQEYLRATAGLPGILESARYHVLRYEDFVTTPETEIPALLRFCGVAPDPACLTPEADQRPILTASQFQARQKITAASVGRARHYEELHAPFAALEKTRPHH